MGDDANVRYLSVQEHGSRTWHVGLQRARLGRDATLRSSAVALGGDYARLRSEAVLAGEGAESDQTRRLLRRRHADARLPHAPGPRGARGPAATCSSRVRSRTRPGRSTRASCGSVPSAQKAQAYQTNRNLVLSEGAGAESIPNLEIEADDVKCSHASAVGPIDDDQLYYLESRGVPPEEAERLIVLGFFDDVFARLPVPSLTSSLTARRWSTRSSTARSSDPSIGGGSDR